MMLEKNHPKSNRAAAAFSAARVMADMGGAEKTALWACNAPE